MKRSCFSSPFKRQQALALRTNVISCVCVFVAVVVVFNMLLFPVWGMFAPLGVYLIKTDRLVFPINEKAIEKIRNVGLECEAVVM